MLTSLIAKSQNYYLNVPVYDTICTGTCAVQASPILCTSYEVYVDNDLIDEVAGVNYYFKILSSNLPADTLFEFTNGNVNVGDSIQLTTADHQLTFSSYSSGSFTYAVLAVGIPSMLNDSFYCKNDIQSTGSFTVDGCLNYLSTYYHSAPVMQCSVINQSTGILNEDHGEVIKLYPNPFSETLNFASLDNQLMEIYVYDFASRIVLHDNFTNFISLNTKQLTEGIYFYEIKNKNGLYKKGKVVKL